MDVGDERATRAAIGFREILDEVNGLEIPTAIFEAAQSRFSGKRYRSRVAETLANWHHRHVELAHVVAESYLADRPSAGFVAARPIFETAMTLSWLWTSTSSPDAQYASLLLLIDKELAALAHRLQSPRVRVREKAERQRSALFGEDREFVDEARAVGCPALPGVRVRIETAEDVLRAEYGEPSRLDGAYGYYRVLSSYGHPTGFGAAVEAGEDGRLRKVADEGWDLLPLMITAKELPLMLLLLVELAGWTSGLVQAKAFDGAADRVYRQLHECYKETIPPLLREFMAAAEDEWAASRHPRDRPPSSSE